MRRQCGPYFDLTDPRHLAWLAGTSSLASLLKLVVTFTVTHTASRIPTLLSVAEVISWAPTAIFGVFVLSLPLLAITSRSAVGSQAGFGGSCLLLVLAGELALIFGPIAFPGSTSSCRS